MSDCESEAKEMITEQEVEEVLEAPPVVSDFLRACTVSNLSSSCFKGDKRGADESDSKVHTYFVMEIIIGLFCFICSF